MDNPSKAISQHTRTRRVILFPFQFQGHINPMIQLANILHSKGFTISIVHTRYNSLDPSKYPHFTLHLIPVGISEDHASKHDLVGRIDLLNTNSVTSFRECLGKLLSTHDDIACIVTDALMYSSHAAADDLGIPRIVLRTSSACAFLAFAAVPVLREKGYFSHNLDSRMEDPVLELPPLRVKDIPAIQAPNLQILNDALKIINNIVEGTKTASGLIFNTFQDLEEPILANLHEHVRVPAFLIGPFHKFFSAASSSLLT